ncbi:MAG: DnaA regulatory inactivator HdaA [Pseudaminobacter sp.]
MREPETPRQLPLELGFATGYSRDDLVVSPANSQAVALIDRWPEWPSPVVVLAGPAGSGKSHLAAIWQANSGATRLEPANIEASLAVVDGAGAVLIDDADSGYLDQNGLFHLINTFNAGGGRLLLTARRFPLAWGVTLPDLASRLKAAATIEIHEPDDLLLAGVITKLFADRQIEVDQAVVQYLVRRIERSLSTAIRVVDRLDRLALEQKTRVSRTLAAEVIEAIDQGQTELDV